MTLGPLGQRPVSIFKRLRVASALHIISQFRHL
jgi:hypothetical protein